MFDAIVIGAGVIGCSIARELSRYDIKIGVLESEVDVATGSSGANSAIVHAGYDCQAGSMMARMNVWGNSLYDVVSKELDVPFKRIGSLVLAFDEEDMNEIQKLFEQGQKNGVPGLKILSAQEVLQMEPNINSNIIAALWAPSAGITCPYELTVAMAENAIQNGVEFFLGYGVENIKRDGNIFNIKTTQGEFKTKYIINCAGIFSDDINRMLGGEEFKIIPRRGEYCLYDRKLGDMVKRVIFQPPSSLGKGVLVTPTVDGNLLIGPNAVDIDTKEDTSTTSWGLNFVYTKALRTIPSLGRRDVIRVFSGIRAVADTGDFILGASDEIPGLFYAAGICSPGLSAAPAIGQYMAELVYKYAGNINAKFNFNPYRKGIPRFRELNWSEKEKLIKGDNRYGQIVCRCETVTEGQIIEAINRPLPALTIDAIKRRTRAGMGRCQGGFCTPKIMEILNRERGIPLDEITKGSGRSYIVSGRIKEGLRGDK